MAEEWITIQHPDLGEARVARISFEKVWKQKGWEEVQEKTTGGVKVDSPSTPNDGFGTSAPSTWRPDDSVDVEIPTENESSSEEE